MGTKLKIAIRRQLIVPQVGILVCTLIKRQVHVLVLIYFRFVCAMVVKKYLQTRDSIIINSFCEPLLVKKLGLRGKESMRETSVKTLTTKQSERHKSKCYSMSVKPLDAEREFELGNVVVVKQIPVTVLCRNVRNDFKRFEHLKDVTLPEIPNATVTLLIVMTITWHNFR